MEHAFTVPTRTAGQQSRCGGNVRHETCFCGPNEDRRPSRLGAFSPRSRSAGSHVLCRTFSPYRLRLAGSHVPCQAAVGRVPRSGLPSWRWPEWRDARRCPAFTLCVGGSRVAYRFYVPSRPLSRPGRHARSWRATLLGRLFCSCYNFCYPTSFSLKRSPNPCLERFSQSSRSAFGRHTTATAATHDAGGCGAMERSKEPTARASISVCGRGKRLLPRF